MSFMSENSCLMVVSPFGMKTNTSSLDWFDTSWWMMEYLIRNCLEDTHYRGIWIRSFSVKTLWRTESGMIFISG